MQAGRGKRAGTRRQVRPCRQAGAGRRRQAQAGAGRRKQAQAGAGRRTNRPTGRRAGEQVRRSGSPRRARARGACPAAVTTVARGKHIQQGCHPDVEATQSLTRLRYTRHLVEEILSLASIFSRGVTQTLGQCKACPGGYILGIMKKHSAWPAYSAEVSPRHWRNTRPGQHIQQRYRPDIGGIQDLPSISTRGVTQTLEEYKAWPAYPAEVSPRH